MQTENISFSLDQDFVRTLLQKEPSRIMLIIMPSNDNLSFTLRNEDYIVTDGVDYKTVGTMQAAINRALRFYQLKVKLITQ